VAFGNNASSQLVRTKKASFLSHQHQISVTREIKLSTSACSKVISEQAQQEIARVNLNKVHIGARAWGPWHSFT
jgi:hypothetical protein